MIPLTVLVVHPMACDACQREGFSGFRYRCQKCHNYQLCQDCFWRGRVSGPHTNEHEVKEYTTYVSYLMWSQFCLLYCVYNFVFNSEINFTQSARGKVLHLFASELCLLSLRNGFVESILALVQLIDFVFKYNVSKIYLCDIQHVYLNIRQIFFPNSSSKKIGWGCVHFIIVHKAPRIG